MWEENVDEDGGLRVGKSRRNSMCEIRWRESMMKVSTEYASVQNKVSGYLSEDLSFWPLDPLSRLRSELRA